MRTRRIAIAVAAALVGGTLVWAQSLDTKDPVGMSGTMHGGAMMAGETMAECEAMRTRHRAAMDEMKAMDARLDELVRAMNAAAGNAKVEATAAVVNELVTQRASLRSKMETLHASMMQHMMRHVQGGMSPCPMMAGDAGGDVGHEAHH